MNEINLPWPLELIWIIFLLNKFGSKDSFRNLINSKLFWQIIIRQKLFQTKNDKEMFQCLEKDFVKPEIDIRVPKKLRKMILSCWESQIESSSSHKLQTEFLEKLKDIQK